VNIGQEVARPNKRRLEYESCRAPRAAQGVGGSRGPEGPFPEFLEVCVLLPGMVGKGVNQHERASPHDDGESTAARPRRHGAHRPTGRKCERSPAEAETPGGREPKRP